jgi:DNA ligase-1
VRLHDLVDTSRLVAATSSRREKVQLLAQLLKRLHPDEIEVAVGFLVGWPRQGKVGVGWAGLQQATPERFAGEAVLDLLEVDRMLTALKQTTGSGSGAVRQTLLQGLFQRSLPEEHQFLSRLLMGELRQGALEGVMADAVAKAADLPAARVRRAVMLAGDLGRVAAAAVTEGEAGLDRFSVRLFQPVQPMLADSAETVAQALGILGRAALEFKLDGARVQVHRSGDQVTVYTRNLNDVTAAVPEIVDAVRALDARELMLDGEVLALDRSGRPLAFQQTMRRFGRRLDVDALRREIPLSPFFFDLLLLDGDALLDRPAAERADRLIRLVPAEARVERIVTDGVAEGQAFFERALGMGHEGLLAKALDAPYEAGRRGKAWLKIKQARTLDLVVLAAEWGHGRRQGTLSNLHLGARDGKGGFVMLGKTFKGMTDEMLAWQTRELQSRATGQDQYTVYVRPELVVEVAFNEIQESPVYPGGLTLRFARVVRYRPDKTPGETDTFETVQALFRKQAGSGA